LKEFKLPSLRGQTLILGPIVDYVIRKAKAMGCINSQRPAQYQRGTSPSISILIHNIINTRI